MRAPAEGREADVLRRAQERLDAGNPAQLRPQAVDQCGGGNIPILLVLQFDEEHALRKGAPEAAVADAAGDVFDGRIGRENAGRRRLLALHVLVGDVLARLGDAEDEAGVLFREEALRNENVTGHRGCHRQAEREERRTLVAKHPGEGPVIALQQPLRRARRRRNRPRRSLCGGGGLHVARRQHRRERQGGQHGHEDAARDGERELPENSADHAAHEQHGYECGNQREADGDHRETDFSGALDGGHHHRIASLQMPVDVLHHDDGVIDDEADRDDERAQGEIVERESQHVHQAHGGDERHTEHGRDDQRGGGPAQKQAHDEDDQHHGDCQRDADVLQRSADGLGPILDQ